MNDEVDPFSAADVDYEMSGSVVRSDQPGEVVEINDSGRVSVDGQQVVFGNAGAAVRMLGPHTEGGSSRHGRPRPARTTESTKSQDQREV